MGFFDKVKQFAGIGGVKVSLEIPQEYKREEMKFYGKLIVTSKSDQFIEKYQIEFQEHEIHNENGEVHSHDSVLGSGEIQAGYEIKADEVKEIPFEFPFDFSGYSIEKLKELSFQSEGLRKVNNFLDHKKINFDVSVNVTVKGVVLGINDIQSVKLIGEFSGSFYDKLNQIIKERS